MRASGLFSSCFTRQQEPKTPDAFAGYRHISTHTYFTFYLHYDQKVTKSKESLRFRYHGKLVQLAGLFFYGNISACAKEMRAFSFNERESRTKCPG